MDERWSLVTSDNKAGSTYEKCYIQLGRWTVSGAAPPYPSQSQLSNQPRQTQTDQDRFWVVTLHKKNRVQIPDGAAGPSIRQPEAASVLE